MPSINDLKQGIIDRIETDAKQFLDDNAGSRDFIYERAERLATLGVTYIAASDDASRERVSEQMEAVRQSIENELSMVAVNASVAARATFMAVVNQVVGMLRTLLPIVVGLLKR
jgi:hypothetical protein